MKALCLKSIAPLHLSLANDIPFSVPGAGEILVRVRAAGVTPTELSWYPTTHTKEGKQRTDPIPGHEFSGEVAALGPGTSGFDVGQEIYGMNDWFAAGAIAEFCVTKPQWIAFKPAGLTHEEAASVPIGALTAWQGLLDRAKLEPGERVLVHGGAGAVGVFVIQLALIHGAHVSATASPRNFPFLKQLGAEQLIDYHADRFESKVGKVDVIFDCVGGETLKRSWAVLKPAGRVVTIVEAKEKSADERAQRAFFIVEPNQGQLVKIGELLNLKQLRPVVDAVVALEQSVDAYTGKMERNVRRGKVVVVVHPPSKTDVEVGSLG
jgi:NADPH:quinone reductase-like Zn-dependent oxidoreductase